MLRGPSPLSSEVRKDKKGPGHALKGGKIDWRCSNADHCRSSQHCAWSEDNGRKVRMEFQGTAWVFEAVKRFKAQTDSKKKEKYVIFT